MHNLTIPVGSVITADICAGLLISAVAKCDVAFGIWIVRSVIEGQGWR